MGGTAIVRTPLRGGLHPHRTLQERLLIRNPERMRRLLSHVLRLPPSSPVRRRVLRDAAEQTYGALNRKDVEAIVARLDPTVEIETEQGGRGSFPDLAESYAGHVDVAELMRRWLSTWEELDWQPVELLDTRDRFVILSHMRVRSPSGLELSEEVGTVSDLRRGWVVRQATYWEWRRTLEIAGFDCEPPAAAVV
jgi:hypothetical protein